jgi:hypothetical protein
MADQLKLFVDDPPIRPEYVGESVVFDFPVVTYAELREMLLNEVMVEPLARLSLRQGHRATVNDEP